MARSSSPDLSHAIEEQIRDSIAMKQRVLADGALIAGIADVVGHCAEALRGGNKVITAGNGGSAADAQHIAGELVSRFYFDRPALTGLALTTNTSVLTAIGNDYGYEQVFARQITGMGRPGDVFIAISTSGNSPNILAALRAARERSIYCVGLAGASGGSMRALCDRCLCVPSEETPRIQEGHELLAHIICAQVEAALFSPRRTESDGRE
jgi:D-sedoheptulose 7-phosphate isomerase